MLQTDDIFLDDDPPCCPGCGATRPENCDCHYDPNEAPSDEECDREQSRWEKQKEIT